MPDTVSKPDTDSSERSGGIRVRESVTVAADRKELYAFWRDLSNLPTVMRHLESVTETSPTTSHWVVTGPLGSEISWNAAITDDRHGESISWRADDESQLPNEGAVGFRSVADGSTEIVVSLTYHPPAGALGAAVAKLLGDDPSTQIREDLDTFAEAISKGSISL